MSEATLEACPYFNKCNVPLCPLDTSSLKNGIWYPDEDICPRRFRLLWLKNQRKIKQRTKDNDRYFTLEMLDRPIIIKTGIVGLDPNKVEENQLKLWLKYHPVKKELSEEEKKRRTALLKNIKSGLNNGEN